MGRGTAYLIVHLFLRSKSENMRKESGYPALAAYYVEGFCLSTKFGVLCGRILPIQLLRDLVRKLSVH